MRRIAILCALVTVALLPSSSIGQQKLVGGCNSQDFIMVFAKNFDIDGATQTPKGNTGRFIVLKKGQSFKGWKLDEERFRWHCGVKQNNWVGPVGEAINDYTKIPGLGEIFIGIGGNWERDRMDKGTKTIDIEYKKDGDIVFTGHK